MTTDVGAETLTANPPEEAAKALAALHDKASVEKKRDAEFMLAPGVG
jgi:hypothetical protein